MTPSKFGSLLDAIEELEMRSLIWGFADGSLPLAQVLKMSEELVGIDEAETLFVDLLDSALLFEVKLADGSIRYRSRFAETVRLLVRLRQLFPKRSWVSAPHLVADYRIDRRRRRYPKRDIAPLDALADLRQNGIALQGIQEKAWHALTTEIMLAGFQVRSIDRIMRSKNSNGTIITAGTGSGKTLAFYLPALLRLATHIEREASWVKIVAIYPRTELLKDQFAEAYRSARLLDTALAAAGKRPISIGALFGTTPQDAVKASEKWGLRGIKPMGRICPFMRCPVVGCDNDLVWRSEDMKQNLERLTCVSCETEVPGSHVVLTRKSLISRPPDLLFTTTEMLNQRLSDTKTRRLFGVGTPASRRPLMVLLDEVHTYAGTTGAQAALTLRRYRHAIGSDVPFAGLSATLAEAPRFFSELTGLSAEAVLEIKPEDNEMLQEGAEYQILLRSEPSAQALSTSIQATMLLARAMDPETGARSAGKFGRRVFVFTDELDVTNRLFDNLRDAEAMTIFGKPDAKRQPLAALRNGDGQAKDDDGQRWRLCEEIGRPLTTRLKVSRTTSQDAGVNAESDVIVASSSLEVGYNDPFVGAVLQHKAPRNAASFLQRKGRAGRSRQMRPFTVTVLSDYGRDRVAFQAFEHLFDPALPPQFLPVQNDYVLRIQAVYSFIDWLASGLPQGTEAWLWTDLSMPAGNANNRLVQRHIQNLLNALLEENSMALNGLKQWLSTALQVDLAKVESLLWEAPRPLLLEAIPTLSRRLSRNWERADRQGADSQVNWHPLPDFVPRTLFDDLNVPDVQIVLPPATSQHSEKIEALPIARTLTDLAPGRVTRRFAQERGKLSHWFPLQWGSEAQDVAIGTYCAEKEFLGEFGDVGSQLPVYRPLKIRLAQLMPSDVLPSSNAFVVWKTQMISHGEPLAIEVPARSTWRTILGEIRFYLHRFAGSIQVRRYAAEAHAELHRLNERRSVHVHFKGDDDESAAVGYEFEADGFYLDVTLPAREDLETVILPPSLLASCRSAYFRQLLLSDKELPDDANAFHREWLCQVLISAAVARAAAEGETLGTAAAWAAKDQACLERVINVIFAISDTLPNEDEGNDDEPDEEGGDTITPAAATRQGSRLYVKLIDLVSRPSVRDRLAELVQCLDEVPPQSWAEWLQSTLLESLGEAVLQACVATAPRHAATDTLVLDVETTGEGVRRIWITETTIGGAGVVQAFADKFSEEPRALFRAIEAALTPTDLELSADGIQRFLTIESLHADVANSADELRATLGHNEREVARKNLFATLGRRGLDVPRALAVSLDARIFRSGTGRKLDQALLQLLVMWDELEAKLGVAIGLREMSYVAASDASATSTLRDTLKGVVPTTPQSVSDFAQVIASLLWPRGVEIRQRSLQSYSRFRTRKVTDPALVRYLLLDERMPSTDVSDPNWHAKLSEMLAAHGTARLCTDFDSALTLRQKLIRTLAVPVEVGYLRFFPTIERIQREENRLVATLTLRECV